jgi:hypothetical protein
LSTSNHSLQHDTRIFWFSLLSFLLFRKAVLVDVIEPSGLHLARVSSPLCQLASATFSLSTPTIFRKTRWKTSKARKTSESTGKDCRLEETHHTSESIAACKHFYV